MYILDEGVINNLPSGGVAQSEDLIAAWQDGKTVKIPLSYLSGSQAIVYINPVQINSDTLAQHNSRYIVDTSANVVNLTLPASPVVGDYIEIVDAKGTFDVHSCVALVNGKKISAIAEDLNINVKRVHIALTLVSESYGWNIDIKLTEFDHFLAKGKDGKDGKNAYELWVNQGNAGKTFDDFLALFKGKDGLNGLNGSDGYTPIKGDDYFDGKDGLKGEKGDRGRDGTNGRDGYTPRKGIDYFDGLNGYTPIKGVDYFDGINGAVGPNIVNEFTSSPYNGLLKGDGTKVDVIVFPNDNTQFLDGTGTFRTITPYTLPIASGTSLGGIKIGSGLAIDGTGLVNVNIDLSSKQDTLVSGTNIKTINGTSLLGSGNISITGGSGASITQQVSPPATPVADDLWIDTSVDENINLYQQSTEPATPVYNDIWIDTSSNVTDFLPSSSSAPTNPIKGDLWLDTSQGISDITNYINLTDYTTDYYLRRGETAFVDYVSATSVPLHIKCDEGIYEIHIIGFNILTASTVVDAPRLLPNNTSYTNAFSQSGFYSSPAGNAVAGNSSTPHSNVTLGWSKLWKLDGSISTYKTAKQISFLSSSEHSGYVGNRFALSQVVTWADVTTAWTSLGTITFPETESGKVFIKRVF